VLGRLTGVRRASVWDQMKDEFLHETDNITVGDVTDFSNFMGAVIDDRAFAKHKSALARVSRNKHLTMLAGGTCDDTVGYFVRPTVVQSTDPTDEMFSDRVLRSDPGRARLRRRDFETVLAQMESFAPYALTGAIIAQDRRAIADARTATLRFAAGQLLHQRQADRRGGGPAALRRCAGQRHQRQGRGTAEPAAVDLAALDQGDHRAAEGLPLSLPQCGVRQAR
jgi:acyl-CoA reductase-like NAD-dependent aldehyde dehydrogenase